jgi:hypothetical protein
MQKENKSWISALVSWRIISTNHIIFLGVLAQRVVLMLKLSQRSITIVLLLCYSIDIVMLSWPASHLVRDVRKNFQNGSNEFIL